MLGCPADMTGESRTGTTSLAITDVAGVALVVGVLPVCCSHQPHLLLLLSVTAPPRTRILRYITPRRGLPMSDF
jgi:hypothetical protein